MTLYVLFFVYQGGHEPEIRGFCLIVMISTRLNTDHVFLHLLTLVALCKGNSECCLENNFSFLEQEYS